MSRDTVNREGLTFEEWVCAAGVALQDHRSAFWERAWPPVLPYSWSDTFYRPGADSKVLLVNGICVLEHKPHRHRHIYYSKNVRQAWKDGVDPTEWRT